MLFSNLRDLIHFGKGDPMTLQSFTLVLHPKSMRAHQQLLFPFQYLNQLATSDKQGYTPCSHRNGGRYNIAESHN